jgi:rhodanese-related sulfurtransferase
LRQALYIVSGKRSCCEIIAPNRRSIIIQDTNMNKISFRLSSLIFLAGVLAMTNAQADDEADKAVEKIDVHAAQEYAAQHENAVLLDVRTPAEYNMSHIPTRPTSYIARKILRTAAPPARLIRSRNLGSGAFTVLRVDTLPGEKQSYR